METTTSSESTTVRRALAAISLIVVAVLLVPAVTGADDFPISTQPMYADVRPERESFVTARGVDGSGATVALSMRQIARTDDPLIARQRLRDAAAQGPEALDVACQDIANRVPEVVEVEIVRRLVENQQV